VFLWLTEENGKTMGDKNGKFKTISFNVKKFQGYKIREQGGVRSIGILKIGSA